MAASPELPLDPDSTPTSLPGATPGGSDLAASSDGTLPALGPQGSLPESCGGFVIERELARGGMGVVYAARHPQLGRRVALKRLHLNAPAGRERFAVEARAAARLRHPNIVGIHSVGEEDGCPFLVMDLIEGASLKDVIRERGPMPSREAAVLCQRLADALAYAHRRSILHRDLKPANILIQPDGQPVITDFGLAKEVEASQATALTRSGQVMGTPAYMPPEQADGQLDVIDRRADIYSLGATLYEMLTGRPPFTGATALNILHAVLTKDPQPPRRRVPSIDPDIETICLKCLEKEPAARYASAQQLAEDLGRYLAEEPIIARRASLRERGFKWLRRNRTLAASLGTTVLAALLVIVGLSARFVWRLQELNQDLRAQADTLEFQSQALVRERAEVEYQLERANNQYGVVLDSFKTLVFSIKDELDDVPGAHIRSFRQRILDTALVQLSRLETSEGRQQGISVFRGASQEQRGELALAAGHTEVAADAFARAADIARALSRRHPDDAYHLRALARNVQQLVHICTRQGRMADAIELQLHSLDVHRRLVALATPQVIDDLCQLSAVLDTDGRLQRKAGNTAAALAAFAEGLEIARQLVAQAPDRPDLQQNLAQRLETVSQARQQQGELPGALEDGLAALAIHRSLTSQDPSPRLRKGLARCLTLLAAVYAEAGQLGGATEALEESLQLRAEQFELDPLSCAARRSLVQGQCARAELYQHQGELAAADSLVTTALSTIRELVDLDPASARDKDILASVLQQAGALSVRRGRLEPARRLFEEAQRVATGLAQQSPHNHAARRDLSGNLQRLGHALLEQGDLAEARESFEQSLQLYRSLADEDSDNVEARRSLFVALDKLAQVAQLQQKYGEASDALEEGLQICLTLVADNPTSATAQRDLSVALEHLGSLRRLQGDPVAAQLCLQEALLPRRRLAALDASNLAAQRDLASALAQLCEAQRDAWLFEDATATGEEALALRRVLLAAAPHDPAAQAELAESLSLLSELYHAQRRFGDGLLCIEQALGFHRAAVALDSTHAVAQHNLANSLHILAELRRRLHQPEAAVAALLEAVGIYKALTGRLSSNLDLWLDLRGAQHSLGRAHQLAGDYPAALAALRAAETGLRSMLGEHPQAQQTLLELGRDILQTELLAGTRAARAPRDFLELGYAQYRRGDYQASVASFQRALRSEALAADLERLNLYNAACAAALAADSAEGALAEELRAQALRWLSEDLTAVRAWRDELRAMTPRSPEEAQAIEAELAFWQDHRLHARERDPDLAGLRALPAFQALFDE